MPDDEIVIHVPGPWKPPAKPWVEGTIDDFRWNGEPIDIGSMVERANRFLEQSKNQRAITPPPTGEKK